MNIALPGMPLQNPFDGGSPSLNSMPLTHIRSAFEAAGVSVSHESRVAVVRTAKYPREALVPRSPTFGSARLGFESFRPA